MLHRVTLIPGDGIGTEIMKAATSILEATGVVFDWVEHEAGIRAYEKTGNPLPETLLDSIKENKVAFKGPLTTLVGEGFPSANVALRKGLDLYANLRLVRTVVGVESRYQDINLVIVRENTEDLYSGIEHMIMPGVTQGMKVITAHASTRIARFAFDYAQRRGRKKVTAVHKANIMKLTDGLFLDSARAVAEEYPDIVSDLCAGLVGGLGMVPAANIGLDAAVFEAVHGSAPDIAGKGVANPTALTFSGVLMLRHLGENEAADAILKAIFAVLEEGEVRTPDLGGQASTQDYAEAVIQKLG